MSQKTTSWLMILLQAAAFALVYYFRQEEIKELFQNRLYYPILLSVGVIALVIAWYRGFKRFDSPNTKAVFFTIWIIFVVVFVFYITPPTVRWGDKQDHIEVPFKK